MPPFPSPHSVLEALSLLLLLSSFSVCLPTGCFLDFLFGVARPARPLKLRAHFEDAAETRQGVVKDQFVRLGEHLCMLSMYV